MIKDNNATEDDEIEMVDEDESIDEGENEIIVEETM